MTYNKLPGMYFSETISANSGLFEQTRAPLFIVQTSTTIATIDDQITHYTGIDAFKSIVEGKGLTQTVKYIEDTLTEEGQTEFYVYSIKTDTATAFTNAIKGTAHLEDITSVVYVEETKSATTNTIIQKIAAIKAGLDDNAENGVFRIAYIVPLGTVEDAVDNAESGTSAESACITSLTTILSGTGNGRICVPLPDENAGIIIGKCLATRYDEEPGYTGVNTSPAQSTYNFDHTQMITLQNTGVLFLRNESLNGINTYRINLGVTTSFKSSAADGLIVKRTTADEVLREIKQAGIAYVKAKETATSLAGLKNEVSRVITEFADEESIDKKATKLTVSDGGNNTFYITGTIMPTGSVIAIEVQTTLA